MWACVNMNTYIYIHLYIHMYIGPVYIICSAQERVVKQMCPIISWHLQALREGCMRNQRSSWWNQWKRFLNSSELWSSMRQQKRATVKSHGHDNQLAFCRFRSRNSRRSGQTLRTLGMKLLETNMHRMPTLIVQHCCHPIVPNLSL